MMEVMMMRATDLRIANQYLLFEYEYKSQTIPIGC